MFTGLCSNQLIDKVETHETQYAMCELEFPRSLSGSSHIGSRSRMTLMIQLITANTNKYFVVGFTIDVPRASRRSHWFFGERDVPDGSSTKKWPSALDNAKIPSKWIPRGVASYLHFSWLSACNYSHLRTCLVTRNVENSAEIAVRAFAEDKVTGKSRLIATISNLASRESHKSPRDQTVKFEFKLPQAAANCLSLS